MKNVRLIISKKGFDVLKSFSDDNYLYSYIVANENQLYDKSMIHNPTILKQIEDYIFFAKDKITEDDELVWELSIQDLKRKDATYYAVLLDPETMEIRVYKNLSGKINLPVVDLSVDDFENIKKIENYNYELSYEQECEEMEV